MGRLRSGNAKVSTLLRPEHLVGRGVQCDLRLLSVYVSTQHAVIRWSEGAWEVVDRGSRNGTYLNGTAISSGASHRLEPGFSIAFGHRDEVWEVTDTGPPQVCVIGIDTAVELLGADGVIGVPSDDHPVCTVYRDLDGRWKLERPGETVIALDDGHTWEAAGMRWRFWSPPSLGPTATSEQRLEARHPTLCFRVSRDEEFVELSVEDGLNRTTLGARSQNYLLLLLARARLSDRAAGHSEASCGWLYKEDLADAVRVTPQQVDGEVHRIRKHFAQHALEEAATIIERRHRTKQLRLGLRNIRILQG